MLHQPSMDAALLAYERARAAAAAAAEVEAELRYALVYDALQAGSSVRETSAMLRIPKSTVARVKLNQAIGPAPWRGPATTGTTWMTPEAYVEAHNAAWAHDETQHIHHAPFGIETLDDGSRVVTAVPMTNRGVAHYRD